jgi:exonuclease III
MKIFSYNCRGLASPKKKSSLKRLVVITNPYVLFLQETLGVSEQVVSTLESLLPGWSFAVVDAKGCSRGLATGWRLKSCKCDRIWGFESGLGLNMFSAELGRPLLLINIYGPYSDRKRYWDSLDLSSWLTDRDVIVGGDLNFSLGATEVWGPRATPDPLTDYFTHFARLTWPVGSRADKITADLAEFEGRGCTSCKTSGSFPPAGRVTRFNSTCATMGSLFR